MESYNKFGKINQEYNISINGYVDTNYRFVRSYNTCFVEKEKQKKKKITSYVLS